MMATTLVPEIQTDLVKIAFVGSSEKWWVPYQRKEAIQFILDIIEKYPNFEIVSGGCPYGGVDIWAEAIAYALGTEPVIFNPKGHGWIHWRNRNMEIAEYCDILYCIEPEWDVSMGASKAYIWRGKKCRRSGGIWTMDYARNVCDKEVYVEVIDG